MPRFDWYQDEKSLTLIIYEPSVLEKSVNVKVDGNKLSVSFNSSNDPQTKSLNLNLFSNVKNPNDSSDNLKVLLTQKKLELKLFKTEVGMWDKLVSEDPGVDCSNKKENSYDKFNDKYLDEELKEEGDDPNSEDRFMKFLQDIYSKGDENIKKAMIKSFTTSSGKVLSTNWDNVKDK